VDGEKNDIHMGAYRDQIEVQSFDGCIRNILSLLLSYTTNYMAKENPTSSVISVPQEAIEQFISALETKGISKSTVLRLKQTLLEEEDYTEDKIKNALFTQTSGI
jgi:hypothetical protein